MDKKIARRAVLGTTIAALAAGPFVMRSLRQPVDLPDQSWETVGRETILANIAKNSRLPVSDVELALAIYQAEREKWLKFRGLKANVRIALEGSSPATHGKVVSFSEEGRMTLKITEEHIEGSQLPWNYYLRYETDGEESSEYTMFSDSSKKPPVMKGRRTEVADPQVLLDVVAAPFTFFVCPWTESRMVMTLLGLDSWRLEKTSAKSIEEGFVFRPTQTKNVDHTSWPEVYFSENCLSTVRGKTHEGYGYTNIVGTMLEISGVRFPSVFATEMDMITEQVKRKCSVVLSEIGLVLV